MESESPHKKHKAEAIFADRVRELESQNQALNVRIQDLEAALLSAAASPSSDSQSLDIGFATIQSASSSVNVQPIISATGDSATDATVVKCCAAVSAGIRRCDHKFLREVFDRHKDGTGRLPASKFTAALIDADAPVVPDSDTAAAAAAIARFDSSSNGLLNFGEFECAVNVLDDLALYFQEKRQPGLADALRALVGRGSDQLLRVSQLSPGDMQAASAAVSASVAEQATSLHAELQRSFAAHFEIQAQIEADAGKFNVVKMACGCAEDFHSGLTGRVGMPHLKFKDAMRQEHCEKAGCNTPFTTGNYKITTTPRQEWLYIAGDETGQQVACADLDHGRRIMPISDLMKLRLAMDAHLTEVEILAIVLYTGPMFQVYNCILRRFPADKYALFEEGGNRYATTIFVLVSAVQKVSRCTRIPEGTLLYRGLGGLIDLPDSFHKADELGRSGFLDWGMMSTSSDRDVALGYSGVMQRRPRAMVMVIQATAIDRGADISEFSQYPAEKEYLWLPCSFVQRLEMGVGRVQVVDGGLVTFVPVRVNLNLKTETVEELLQKKKSMHVTAFEFRVSELRQRLQDEAKAGNAEARLKNDKDDQGMYWEKEYSVGSYIEAQVKKVEAVMERHRALSAADYSDDALYRSLVAESLDVTSMAQSALQLWLRNVLWKIHKLEEKPLLECHRNLETFLRRRYAYAATEEERRAAAFELCRVRHLMSSDVNEVDGNGEPPLVALAARGGSGEDVALLVAAGADFTAVEASNRCAMHFAAQQGHVEAINALVHVGANYNQMRQSRVGATDKGETPIWRASANGHLGSVKALCEAGADVNQAAAHDGSTPLFMASQMGHSSVVEALLAWGADINQANTVDGCTPILIASRFGYSVIVKALLAAGGDVSKSLTSGPNKGASPVWAAAFSGRSECLQLLLAAGCDVNACTDDGRSPVDIATANGHTHMVQRLLSAGASQSSRVALGFRDLPAQDEYAANDP